MTDNKLNLEAFEKGLDTLLAEFLQEYEHGLEAAKSQGHNTEYHTFDSQVNFKEAIMQQVRELVAAIRADKMALLNRLAASAKMYVETTHTPTSRLTGKVPAVPLSAFKKIVKALEEEQ